MPVEYCFKGHVDNEDVLEYYKNMKVDCFITTSSTEGLPVSIMEAMSFGIPIIAPNVGGIEELIDGNGFLLSENPNVNEVSDAIIKLLRSDKSSIEKMRMQSKSLWKNKFNAKKNATAFAEDIYNQYGKHHKTMIITVSSLYADASFIKAELVELSKRFRIIVIETEPLDSERAMFYGKNILNEIDSSIEYYQFRLPKAWRRKTVLSIRYFTDGRTKTERADIKKNREKLIRRTIDSMYYYVCAELFFEWMKHNGLIGDEKIVFYSFWQHYPTLSMCMHKHRNIVITRTHGYDLYNERVKTSNRQPFKIYMNTKLDYIFFVCKKGRDYYLNHWRGIEQCKLVVSYLGSNGGIRRFESIDEDEKGCYRIVSCSNVISIKRIDKIIDALKKCCDAMPDLKIKWVHFGNGDLLTHMKVYAEEKLQHV